ncbi:pyridoxamine 5'-phosphate oxidase family protein [Saccharomonospora piscinae]|uniref:Pyridoxamine 5'-phosphate oxidase n=1 Tax=Saccharomonospora piscinae TaxID=687388 RepID=A0A1V8ZZ57_SACPI|nr:pyridoxamine 5'-phosphate oxidase family protein [Saccharomonospora piscinae]OQO90076.1 pyridoxamine 5'-phosphate oxidase [Saccharomonospora piscinae]TLW90906.1 pyridoxamine 5'-phosphate oxidase family protein [Saccharomonospora piscinae]
MTTPMEMTTLTEAECLALLSTEPVGRLVFTENALPAIRPVNFVLDGRDVVIRTTADSWARRVADTVVAFEVDHIVPADHSGWSVVLLGTATVLTDIDALVRVTDFRHRPWAPGPRDRYLLIRTGEISGRRLSLAPA